MEEQWPNAWIEQDGEKGATRRLRPELLGQFCTDEFCDNYEWERTYPIVDLHGRMTGLAELPFGENEFILVDIEPENSKPHFRFHPHACGAVMTPADARQAGWVPERQERSMSLPGEEITWEENERLTRQNGETLSRGGNKMVRQTGWEEEDFTEDEVREAEAAEEAEAAASRAVEAAEALEAGVGSEAEAKRTATEADEADQIAQLAATVATEAAKVKADALAFADGIPGLLRAMIRRDSPNRDRG